MDRLLFPVLAPALYSYVNYLNDASNDPYSALPTSYTDVIAPFSIDTNNSNNNQTPANVRTLVLGA